MPYAGTRVGLRQPSAYQPVQEHGGGSERLTSKDHPACRQGLNGEHLEMAVVGSGGDGRGRCGV